MLAASGSVDVTSPGYCDDDPVETSLGVYIYFKVVFFNYFTSGTSAAFTGNVQVSLAVCCYECV
jgi:hypothetical protein